jgi:Ca-activated chloride channel family protein
MSFLTPIAFALALLLPLIVAMYLLKLRRTEQVVSSVFLWRRMVRDVEANAPWQRLRRNLLLFLQLLFLAALILALARPFTWAAGASGQTAILLIDTSASMAATDVSPSRMEEAKAQARQLVNGLPEEARVTVIAAGQGARVLVASSQDRRQVLQAIDELRVEPTSCDLTSALQLAAAIAARQPDTDLAILSDGKVSLPERLAIKGRVSYYPIGLSGDNQAISLLTLEAAPGGSLNAFAQVTNYGDQPAQRRLELYADGALFNAYDLDIPAGEQRPVLAADLPPETHLVEARLNSGDALQLDDRAWAVYRPVRPAVVRLVTDGNLFLQTALQLLPDVEVSVVKPADWGTGRLPITPTTPLSTTFPASQLASPASNLTIFDSFIPTGTLPGGNLLFIAPVGTSGYFTVTGTIKDPILRPANVDDPLLTNVNLAGINVLDSARIPLPDWARPVIVGDTVEPASGGAESAPLLFVGEVDGRRLAVLAFDLHHSDLPLQVAFPLLLSNLVSWLAPGAGSELPTQVSPGTALNLQLPLDVEAATLTRPSGSQVRLSMQAGQAVIAEVDQLGVYQLSWNGDEPIRFAADLFSPQESDVKPAGSLPGLGAQAAEDAAHPQQARREWWRPLAFLCLALLMAEWLVYQRATLARMAGRLATWKAGRIKS